MCRQQTKLIQRSFVQPEKISQPGAQPETPSPSFVTVAACLIRPYLPPAKHGATQLTAKTLGRKVCRAQSPQHHSISFCQHRGHANISALRGQLNPALKRDVPQAARPFALQLARTHMDAENTYQVFDWLWTSGQLSEKDIACLPALGIDAVINLALPTASNALPGEAEFITRQGIAYIHIPVVWERPQLHQLEQFFGTLKAFEGRNVWVHCAKNMRVSAFIYLYRRLYLAESEEVAVHPMQEVWVPNETWQAFIHSALSVRSNPAFERDAPKAARPLNLNVGHRTRPYEHHP